jgi:hypothetical protein
MTCTDTENIEDQCRSEPSMQAIRVVFGELIDVAN